METASSQERCYDRLDLRAPLVSTRRSTGSVGATKATTVSDSNEASPRVPFLWERTAGVPKESVRRHNLDEHIPMPPRPPPGRWEAYKEELRLPAHRQCPRTDDDGNEGDIDRGDGSEDDDDDDDAFSDALDRLSFSELSGVTYRFNEFDGRVSKDMEPSINRAPSFIMNRFLPAAHALANSSTHKTFKYLNRREQTRSHQRPQKEPVRRRPRHRDAKLPTAYVPPIKTRPQSPPTACGLMLLSPWSLNHRLCGFKSPVRCQTPAAIKAKDHFGHGLRCEVNTTGSGGCDDRRPNTKAWQSPRWGLSFLDTSRLRTTRANFDRRKAKASMEGRDPKGNERAMWSLPSLKTPSESWLSRALNSFHRAK